jgi:hypothetical protein
MTDTPRWAVLSGIAGLVANAFLILFFALSHPWTGGPSGYAWLGPANDVLVVVQFGALIPVAMAAHARLRLDRGVTAAGVSAIAAVVVLQLALLAGLLAFEVQVLAVVVCLAVTFGWVLVASRAGRATLPAPVVRLGTVVGATFLAGLAVAGAGMLAPPGSVARYVAWGLGGLTGSVGYLGLPLWPLALARQVAVPAGAVPGVAR